MGNAASDSAESDAYNVIRWLPGLGQVYSFTRAIVYVSKRDDQKAIDSVISITWILGNATIAIRDSDLFGRYENCTDFWVGNKQEASQLPSDHYSNHVFDASKFMYLFDNTASESALELLKLSRDEISNLEGTFVNDPAVARGVREFSYFNAISECVVLTSYRAAYSNKSAQCAVFVTTFKFYSSYNIFKVTELSETKRKKVEGLLLTFRQYAIKMNAKNSERQFVFGKQQANPIYKQLSQSDFGH